MATTGEDQCDYCGAVIISNVHMHTWERDDGDENVLCVDCTRIQSEETYQKEERLARGAKDDKKARDLSGGSKASAAKACTEEQGIRKGRHFQVQGVRSRRGGRSDEHPALTEVPVRGTGESVGGVSTLGGGFNESYEQEFPDTYGIYPREPHGN